MPPCNWVSIDMEQFGGRQFDKIQSGVVLFPCHWVSSVSTGLLHLWTKRGIGPLLFQEGSRMTAQTIYLGRFGGHHVLLEISSNGADKVWLWAGAARWHIHLIVVFVCLYTWPHCSHIRPSAHTHSSHSAHWRSLWCSYMLIKGDASYLMCWYFFQLWCSSGIVPLCCVARCQGVQGMAGAILSFFTFSSPQNCPPRKIVRGQQCIWWFEKECAILLVCIF